jgi:hypothetical protein
MTTRASHARGIAQVDRPADRRAWRLLAGPMSTNGLWILPALWKTPQTGVSHSALENRTDRGFPQAPQASPSWGWY